MIEGAGGQPADLAHAVAAALSVAGLGGDMGRSRGVRRSRRGTRRRRPRAPPRCPFCLEHTLDAMPCWWQGRSTRKAISFPIPLFHSIHAVLRLSSMASNPANGAENCSIDKRSADDTSYEPTWTGVRLAVDEFAALDRWDGRHPSEGSRGIWYGASPKLTRAGEAPL